MGLFKSGTVVPVLRLSGAIGMAIPFRPGLSLVGVAGAIHKAFAIKKSPAVAVVINSPGGSPVQSRLIYKRIRDLAEEKRKKVYVFTEDVAASGGYMLALAGDEIYADPTSIVGSIGVISSGFGFDKMIEKIGVERRVYTAGKHKLTLDPFQPENPADVERLKDLQRDVHDVFVAMVRERRGSRLKGEDEALFNGDIWSGGKALELGLIDGLSDVRTKMRELYGKKVQLKLMSPERGWFRRASRRIHRPGGSLPFNLASDQGGGLTLNTTGLTDDLISSLETRALWARYGL